MIEKLYYTPDMDSYGNCYGSTPPSISQIVNKLNEIIDYINSEQIE